MKWKGYEMGKHKREVLAVVLAGSIFFVSWLSWQLFVVGYLGLASCSVLQFAGLWGLVLTVLALLCLVVEVLRDRH